MPPGGHAVAGHPVKVADDQISSRGGGGVGQDLHGVGGEPVIGVHKLQIGPLRPVQSQIAAFGHPAVGGVYHQKTGLLPGIAAADVQRAVGAAVIDQNDFKIPKGLGQNGIQSSGKIGLCVVDGQDEGDGGGHGRTSVSGGKIMAEQGIL